MRRVGRVWLALGLLIAGAALIAPVSFATNETLWRRLMDAGHLPLGFALTLLLEATNPFGIRRPATGLAAAVLASLLFGAATESIQPLTGREESLADFTNAALGTGMAWLFRSNWPRGATLRGVIWGVSLFLAAALCMPAPWREWQATRWRTLHFPLLADFEEPAQMPLWRTPNGAPLGTRDRSSEVSAHGRFSLKVSTGPERWPGVRLCQNGADWRGHEALALEAFNPGDAFDLGLRIDGAGPVHGPENRFNATLPLARGWNRLRIPLAEIAALQAGRQCDLSAVQWVVFFVDGPTPARTFYLDELRLEPAPGTPAQKR